jgi:Domain of unknown function (DUF6487)
MKCPECDEDMEKGQFSLPSNTVWTPAGVKKKFGVIADDMVWLAKRWNLFPQRSAGYVCRACKVAVLEYPGK